jgi:Spy/CpxP family protein refolding chaperone
MRHITSTLLISTLLVTSLLPTWALAQELDFMKIMRSQKNRVYHKDGNREKYRALWNGNGAVVSVIPIWSDEEFLRELDFTPEQREQIDFMFSKGGSMGHWYQTKRLTDPVLDQMIAENEPLNEEMRKDPYGENTSPEVMQIYHEQLRALTAYYFAETHKDVENTLTPEQMQKIRESELALMSEIPILNPSMFYSLDLTDEQKEQMEEIKMTLEPVFEQIVEELVEMTDAVGQARLDVLEEVGIKCDENGQCVEIQGKSLRDDPEATKQKMNLLETKMRENTDLQARIKRINNRASGFMRDFKFKMYDVLTDEQLIALQRMINNPSPHVKKLRDRLQKERAEREKSDWQPGINSWRPGDPVPVEYLEQRQQRRRLTSE